MSDIKLHARLLGGEAFRNQIYAPGPGHSKNDRSLALKACASSPIGYLFHSFAGDDPAEIFAYIRCKLGLPDAVAPAAPPIVRPSP